MSHMGAITRRVSKSGQTEYTVQIRLRRKGVIVYQESQSFDHKPAARAWMMRREAELAMIGPTATGAMMCCMAQRGTINNPLLEP